MKIKIIVILVFILIVLVRIPVRKILVSPLQNGKYITFFSPLQLRWQNEYYIIPDKFKGMFRPANNYFILTPMGEDQDMTVDWKPLNYELAIQLPFCEDIQKVIYNIDTAKYHIAKNCGYEDIDQSDSGHRDVKRFSYYKIEEWLP